MSKWIKNSRDYLVCPACGEKTLEEHGTEPGEHHWFFCRTCGKCYEENMTEAQ